MQLPQTATSRRIRATVRPTTHGGRRVWVVSWWIGGKRKRRFAESRGVADEVALSIMSATGEGADAWASLPAGERDEILRIVGACRARGVSLSRVWSEWAASADRPQEECGLGKAFAALLEAKTQAKRAPRYVTSLRQILGRFVRGREALPIAGVTVDHVESYLVARPPGSRSTIVARLSTLFEFAIRRGWCASNPVRRLEPVTASRAPVAVFTPEDAAKALAWLKARPRALGWFVLSTFCGLRPEEAEKTPWSSVVLSGAGLVRVEAQTSKVRARRVVYPRPEAVKWLRVAKRLKSALPIPHTTRRRECRALASALGWDAWPQDITRHTAASYWLASSRNLPEVAVALGNSPGVLKAHYDARVTREAAARFWGILP